MSAEQKLLAAYHKQAEYFRRRATTDTLSMYRIRNYHGALDDLTGITTWIDDNTPWVRALVTYSKLRQTHYEQFRRDTEDAAHRHARETINAYAAEAVAMMEYYQDIATELWDVVMSNQPARTTKVNKAGKPVTAAKPKPKTKRRAPKRKPQPQKFVRTTVKVDIIDQMALPPREDAFLEQSAMWLINGDLTFIEKLPLVMGCLEECRKQMAKNKGIFVHIVLTGFSLSYPMMLVEGGTYHHENPSVWVSCMLLQTYLKLGRKYAWARVVFRKLHYSLQHNTYVGQELLMVLTRNIRPVYTDDRLRVIFDEEAVDRDMMAYLSDRATRQRQHFNGNFAAGSRYQGMEHKFNHGLYKAHLHDPHFICDLLVEKHKFTRLRPEWFFPPEPEVISLLTSMVGPLPPVDAEEEAFMQTFAYIPLSMFFKDTSLENTNLQAFPHDFPALLVLAHSMSLYKCDLAYVQSLSPKDQMFMLYSMLYVGDN